MNCNSFLNCCINVIINCSFLENLLHRKSSSRNFENWSITKKARKLLCIHCCGCNDELDVPSLLSDFFKNTKKHISVKTSLMGLVHDDGAVHFKLWIVETFSEEHTISHVLDDSFFGSAVLKTD